MFFNRHLVIIGVSMITACTSNKKDKVDCSISTLNFTTEITDAECGQSNGTISISTLGGEMPYMYFIDNGATQSSNNFSGLQAGNYEVTVVDAASCSISMEVSIGNVGGFQATASVDDAGCQTSNGSITAQPSGGVEPYQYQLNGGAAQTSATFSGLSADEYEVLITDAMGCSFSVLQYVPHGTSYTTSVQPIIANSCATTGCHDGSTSQTNFTNFSNVQQRADAIKSRTQGGSMPPDGTLTQEQKDAIACWVDDGALDN